MERYNNWMSYSFNGVEYGNKNSIEDQFTINFNVKTSVTANYHDALLNNAKIMRDSYTEPFDVCLSGGLDSEIVVRVFKDVGIKHNTYIFKLENDYNIRDYTNAVKLCELLNIPYKVIDFNVQYFFENDALDLLNKTHIPYVGRLPRLKFLDYLDNIPVFCDGEPYWKRKEQGDYGIKSDWNFYMTEDAYLVSIYANRIGRTVIGDWYEFTPNIIMSYHRLPYVKKLFNDEVYGKTSNVSSKGVIHREYWPDLEDKAKLVGYEGLSGSPGERPEFMNEFYNQYMSKIKNASYSYSIDDLNKLILL